MMGPARFFVLLSLFVQASESSNKDHGSDDDCKPLGKKSEPRNHSATRTATKPVAPHHACAAFRFDFLHGRCSLDRVSTTSRSWMTKPIDVHLAGVFEGTSYSEEGNKTTSSRALRVCDCPIGQQLAVCMGDALTIASPKNFNQRWDSRKMEACICSFFAADSDVGRSSPQQRWRYEGCKAG
jgi:hypothetical protein